MATPEASPDPQFWPIKNASEYLWEHLWFDTADNQFYWAQLWSPNEIPVAPASLLYGSEQGQARTRPLTQQEYDEVLGLASAIDSGDHQASAQLSELIMQLLQSGQEG